MRCLSGGCATASSSVTLNPVNPNIAITSLSDGSYINAAMDSAVFAISGTCTAAGGTVTVQVDGANASGQVGGACNGATWNATINTTGLTQASHAFTAVLNDGAGNLNTSAWISVTRDVTAPAVALTTPANASFINSGTDSATFAVSGTCNDAGRTVTVTVDGASSASQVGGTCNGASWSATIDTTGLAAGTRSFRAVLADAAGNSTTTGANSVTRDVTAPAVAITIPSANTIINSTSDSATYTVSGTCNENGRTVTVRVGSSDATGQVGGACDGVNFSATIDSTAIAEGSQSLTAVISDAAGNSTTSSGIAVKRDLTSPVFTASQMTLNGGAATTVKPFLTVALQAVDAVTNVTHFCLKTTIAAPGAADTCWVAVNAPSPGLTPAMTLSLSNFPFRVDFTPQAYTVFAWVKDEAGNISSLTAAGAGTAGRDKATITYAPAVPPTMINVSAFSTNAPSSPPVAADYAAPNPSSVYIKWNVTDDKVLPANPINLYYTTDDSNYTLIAANVANSANAGCTINGTQTGCYVWNNNVTSNYIRIRVGATDSDSTITFVSAAPLNVTSPFNFIAGNTDPGLNGSATSAIFFNDSSSSSAIADMGSLAVTEDGIVYFRDWNRGILKVDPNTGIQTLLVPTTGTANGDGGPISGATLRKPYFIALDYQNRILVYDYDRIRRIDTTVNPMTIETLIGGGAQSSADNVLPTDVQIINPETSELKADVVGMPFFVLPNGDIYFQSDRFYKSIASGAKIRVYKPSTNRVTSFTLTGTGNTLSAGQDISLCRLFGVGFAFDSVTSALTHAQAVLNYNGADCSLGGYPVANLNPATGVVTAPHPNYAVSQWLEATAVRVAGRDGNLYAISRQVGNIFKYNTTTRTWTTLLGTGTPGYCADGVPATACDVSLLALDVTPQGKIYFVDSGRIRTIDSLGNVVTIMGQSFFFGDGGLAMSARFNVVNNIERRNSGETILLDQQERRFREFTTDGNIQTIAGTGNFGMPDTISLAVNQPLSTSDAGQFYDMFSADPASGDVYYYRNSSWTDGKITKLDRSTGRWSDLIGGGATLYSAANGLAGSNIDMRGYPGQVFGYDGTRIAVAKYRYSGGYLDPMFLLYDLTAAATQSLLAGKAGAVGAFAECADGTASNACDLYPAYTYSKAVYDSLGARWLFLSMDAVRVRVISGGTVNTLTTLTSNARSIAYKRNAGLTTNIIFYCSTSDDKIHKMDINAATDTALSWPIPNMKCAGKSLLYDPVNDKLIFPYIHNGLYGIAEYLSL